MERLLFLLIPLLVSSCRDIPVYNLENPVYKAYLDQTIYPDDDYSFTNVKPYAAIETDFRKDRPNPVPVRWESTTRYDSIIVDVYEAGVLFCSEHSGGATEQVDIWNLIPGRNYSYIVSALRDSTEWTEISSGQFRTSGRRRMMNIDGVGNCRDLGGLKTLDGRTIRYGRIYRGGQTDGFTDHPITPKGLMTMLDFMKISVDIDYRDDWDLCRSDETLDNDIHGSGLGNSVAWHNFQTRAIDGIKKETAFGDIYKLFLKSIREGRNIYTHCIAGADRTGIMCLLLEASLGVSENDLIKDYETTSFSEYGVRERSKKSVRKGMTYIKELEGETFQDKCRTLLKNQGVTDAEIAEFQSLMLE